MITGYLIYCKCNKLKKKYVLSFDKYLNCSYKNYFEAMAKLFIDRGLTEKDVDGYICCVYNNDVKGFDPFSLINEDNDKLYEEWEKNKSTVSLYLQHVKEGFDFIENYCIKNNLSFEDYCEQYIKSHVRENKVDEAIVVYMKLIDRRKLKRVEKILLRSFINNYDNVKLRILDKNLNALLKERSESMLKTIKNRQICNHCI